MFLLLTVKNSVGNVVEIINLLDKDVWSGDELRANYIALVEKWGEWEIINESGAGIVVRYVDVGNALFSGLAITFATCTFIALLCAIVLGKIVFPLLATHYQNINNELVDLTTLHTATQIDNMTKQNKKEWF